MPCATLVQMWMQKVDELSTLIQEQLDSVNKSQKIPWELNEKLPNKIARVPATILAPTVPLENLALVELSELVMKTNMKQWYEIKDRGIMGSGGDELKEVAFGEVDGGGQNKRLLMQSVHATGGDE